MKALITLALLLCAAMSVTSCDKFSPAESRTIAIIPEPSEVTPSKGKFTMYESDIISIKGQPMAEVKAIAEYFESKIDVATGYVVQIEDNAKGRIAFEIVNSKEMGAEGYRLNVTQNQITVKASAPAGLFYGVQTLLQLFPAEIKSLSRVKGVEWSVPCVDIVDTPRFGWRGVMLDVSRHFFTKEEVMRYIDQMAEYKMNVFHWHLADDQGWRLEIKSCPELIQKGCMRASRVGDWWSYDNPTKEEPQDYGGYYTQDDVREVLAYAAARYVTVVPEIDVPGHSLEVLVAYPELACLKAPEVVNTGNKFYMIDENSLCVGNEASFAFLDKVFTEVAELFPSEYIHIGGDECYKGFWQKCPKCRARMWTEKLENVEQLQSYFIKRVDTMLASKGKKIIGWDEILEGGLAPSATVMSWRGTEGGIAAAKMGHHVIMTPNDHCYIDLYQGEPSAEPCTYSMCRLSDSYGYEPVSEGIPAEMVLGGQGNLWTESVPTFRHVEYMSYPRVWALSEVFWSGADKKNWDAFVPKVEEHFRRADNAEINYASSVYHPIIQPYTDTLSGRMLVELKSEIADVDIYYTIDNTLPDTFTPKYEGTPFALPKNVSRIQAITYRDGKPLGRMVAVEKDEIAERAGKDRR